MKSLLIKLRRATAWTRMVWADINVETLRCGLRDARGAGEPMRILRRLVAERARRATARADYQATLPVGQRCTWIDA